MGSATPAVLVGMRAVGDLVGQAIDAQRSTQQQQPSSGPTPTTSTTTAYSTPHSALMRIAGTTYRISLPSSTPPGPQQPTGASRRAVASPRTGDRQSGTGASQLHTPATPPAHQPGSGYARTDATKNPSAAPGAQNHSSNAPQQPAAKHPSAGSPGGSRSSTSSRSSIKELKAKHSNSKNNSSTKTASTKTAGTKTASTKTAGTKTAGTKTAGTKTAGTKTAGTKTAGTKTAGTKTAGTKRSGSRWLTARPELIGLLIGLAIVLVVAPLSVIPLATRSAVARPGRGGRR